MAASSTTLPVPQLQVLTYNHPCGDLFDGGRRSEYLDFAVPLYRASIAGDLETAKVILKGREHLLRCSITENKESPLHVAAAGCSYELVQYLVNMMDTSDMKLQNRDGNTAFCIAAISGHVDMVKVMFGKNTTLPNIPGSENMMPLHLAAYHGNHDVVTFLYDQASYRTRGDSWTNDIMDGVLLKCIQADMFDVVLRILTDNKELPQEKHVWDMLQVLARKREVFNKHSLALFLTSPGLLKNHRRIYSQRQYATSLLRLLWKRIMKKPKDVIDEILKGPMIIVEKSTDAADDLQRGSVLKECKVETYPSQILFIAAKMNNARFLVELIRKYPDLIWKRKDDGQTIFHVAVAHRHQDIYNLLYEIGSMKDLITPLTDKQGNNILHLVGKNPEKRALKDTVANPFQVRSEFLWYKEVECILPSLCREAKNIAGQTPQELFTENHEKQVSKAMESIKQTINTSMVVVVLVGSIGFSVAYSIPGGFHQDTGLPVLLHNSRFMNFVLLDVMSFFCSTYSIILFLSVTLSDHQGDMRPLLNKWFLGQMSLLFSVYFLVAAFIFSIFLLYPQSIKFRSTTYSIAITGATGFAATLCYVLFILISPTSATRLFGRKKHTLHPKILRKKWNFPKFFWLYD